MIKLLITLLAATITMVSCTSDDNDDPTPNADRRITFARPVVKGITRAVTGEIINGTYPVDEKFVVYGKKYDATETSFTGWTTRTENAFATESEVFTNASVLFPGVFQASYGWITATPYMFDPNKKYAFGAYSPADANGTITYDDNGLKIENFEAGTPGSQYDLMYSPRITDVTYMSKTNHPTGNGNNDYDGVNLVFKHALASVHIYMVVDPKFLQMEQNLYKNTVKQDDFTMQSVKICNVNLKGTFNENISTTSPAWTFPTPKTIGDVVLFETDTAHPDGLPVTIKDTDINAKSYADIIKEPERDIATMFGDKGHYAFVIPQTFIVDSYVADAPGATLEMKWKHKYTLNKQPMVNDMYTTFRFENLKAFEAGKRYNLYVWFTGNLISFNTEILDWTDESSSGNLQ